MTTRHGFLAGTGATVLAARLNAGAQALPHLSVGTVPTDAGMPPVFAQRAGFFRRNGVDVDVQFMNSGSAMASAVAGGALNIGGTSVMGLITAHLKGIPFQIIAPATVYVSARAPEKLVVRKDSPIHTAADLNGKTIGAPSLSDLYSISTYAWVDQNGGDSKTLHEIEVPSAAAPAMLDAGRIDAAVLPEPLLSQTVIVGNLQRVIDAAARYKAIDHAFDAHDMISPVVLNLKA